MNCLLEAVATVYLHTRKRLVPDPVEEEIYTAQDNLESCRKTMESREAELSAAVVRLGREALARRRAGDLSGAKSKLLERHRACKRLDKLRSGICLVDGQLEALKNSELDKEIMMSLKASTTAMKRAGVTVAVEDVEQVMHELDDQIAQVQDVTTVLANPVGLPDDLDLEAELAWLEEGGQDTDAPMPAQAKARAEPPAAPVAETAPPPRENLMEQAY